MTENETQIVETKPAKRKAAETTALAPQSLTPAQMLSLAVQQDAPVEKLNKLMDLQERWEKNEARKAFEMAMVKFSAAVPTIAKTRKGHNNKYAGLPETVEEVQGLMAECQLSRRWADEPPKVVGNIRIRCIISHILGHSESFALEAGPDKGAGRNDIQAVASTITYLRRITLFSVLGLVAGDEVDDDGAGGKTTDPPKPASESALGDPEEAVKRQFLAACRKKLKDEKLSTAIVGKLFAAAQQACGSTQAQKCLEFIGKQTTILKKDGTISVEEGPEPEPPDPDSLPEWDGPTEG